MLSTDLILKGLGGVAVVGGTTGVGVWYLTKNKTEELRTFAERVGLSCTFTGDQFPSAGVNCTKLSTFTKNIKAKKGDTSVEVSNLPSANSGKIKVYKTSTGEKYNNNFKFVIEENDISGTDANNKLEQFETYEINKEGDGADWKLIRKSEAKDGIKKALGLDQISGCDLPKADGCEVDGDKIKKIKFEGGNDGGENGPSGAKLKITSGADTTEYPFGYKFVLESAGDVTISNSVSAKANTNTEFKIKRQTNSNNITLEKAWTFATLGEKVNLTCTVSGDGGTTKECSLATGKKINVKDGSKKRKEAAFQTGSGDKKLTFEEGAEGHNQGIKLTTSTAITLQNGTPESNSPTSIEGTNATYQIIKDGDEWYLSKVTSGGAGG